MTIVLVRVAVLKDEVQDVISAVKEVHVQPDELNTYEL